MSRLSFVFPALALLVVAGLAAALHEASAQSPLPRRVVIINAAVDGLPTNLPPPDPGYCQLVNPGSTPPSSVLGTLTIAGQPAPVGTVVQLVLGDRVGPADATFQAGGYRIDYTAGAAGCVNQLGTTIGVLVNGQVFMSTVKVGDSAAEPFFRFDIAVP